MQEIIKEFNMTGPCIIDIDALEQSWDHSFWLSQWGDEYRLIQYLRRGSGKTKIKCSISQEQAQEIIKRLELVHTQSLFASGGSWRKVGASEFDMQPKLMSA
jgi:hypothetical protein